MSSLEKTLFLLSYFLSAQSCDKSEAATTCYSHVLKYFEAINYYYYYYLSIAIVNVEETKYFTFSKKWEAISHGKAFIHN